MNEASPLRGFKHRKKPTPRPKILEEVFSFVSSSYSVTSKQVIDCTGFSAASVRWALKKLDHDSLIKVYKEERPFRYSIW